MKKETITDKSMASLPVDCPTSASGFRQRQRDLKIEIQLPLLYSMNHTCVGCNQYVRSIRQEEIFISDGKGFRC
jgi:hypothetical protein